MKSLTYAAFALSLLLPTGAVLALPVKTVPSNNLQGMVVKVWAGYDLSMDFIGSGEVVTNAVIGNPSIVLGGLGGTLCPRISTSEQECNNTGAPAIYLRQTKIDPQSSYLLPSADGKTSLILTTSGPEGIKNYVLTILPARGNPEYAGLEIKSPVVQEPPQVVPPARIRQNLPMVQAPSQPTSAANAPQWQAQTPATANSANNTPNVVSLPPASKSPIRADDLQQVTPTPNQNPTTPTDVVTAIPEAIAVPKVTPLVAPDRPSANEIADYKQPSPNADKMETSTRTTPPLTSANNIGSDNNSITQANALVRGLTIARQKGQINFETTTWKKVQSVVRLLRRGEAPQSAAQEVEISLQLINQLLAWGQGSSVVNRNK